MPQVMLANQFLLATLPESNTDPAQAPGGVVIFFVWPEWYRYGSSRSIRCYSEPCLRPLGAGALETLSGAMGLKIL